MGVSDDIRSPLKRDRPTLDTSKRRRRGTGSGAGIPEADIKKVEMLIDSYTLEQLEAGEDRFKEHIWGWGAEGDKLRKRREKRMRELQNKKNSGARKKLNDH
jgi:hypothetical protein